MTNYRTDAAIEDEHGLCFGNADAYYGLTPTLFQQDRYGPEVNQFESMFLNVEQPSFHQKPTMKRAISSSDSLDMHPDMKKHRIHLFHTDSDRSSVHTAISSATSNNDSGGSNHASPPSDARSNNPSPAPETLADRLANARAVPAIQPALPTTASGQTPSVLLPAAKTNANYGDLMRNDAQMEQMQSQVQRSLLPTSLQREYEDSSDQAHSPRRSKTTAMQHLEDVSQDEQDEARYVVSSKGKQATKRQSRKKSKQASIAAKEEEQSNPMDGDEEKRAQFLERNRLAACKSRQKKKEWIKSLESQGQDLNRQNGELQVLITALRDEITSLRGALAARAQCACRMGNGQSPPAQAMPETLPQTADAATFAAAPWAGITSQGMSKDLQPRSSISHRPGVIDFNGLDPHHPSGITPFLQSGVGDTSDYFGQSFGGQQRQTLSTPELARSLGYNA